MSRISWFIFFIVFPLTVFGAADDVAYSTEWLALGHYRPKMFGGYKSSIDSDNFFVAKDGKTNPKAELRATIELFAKGEDKDKICLFQARYLFLKNKKLINDINVKCEEYNQFKSDLNPSGVTLLFTDAYMNNPSSLFGHTLLRIDTARKGTQLLAHGANYGAFTNGAENSVLFAVYGLTGGYFGGWTVKPYYDVINKYNNIENRDIWELNLDLSPQEIDMFVAHLWELGHTQTRYYFFSKNCSYMIMEMLDAVRPGLGLSDKFPAQTIPVDTIKAVYRSENLVKDINYRPSRQAKIVHREKQMNRMQKKAFVQAIKHEDYGMENVPDGEKADVLETAYQYVQYQFVKRDFDIKEYRKRSFMGLMARNKLQDQKAKMSENPEGRSPLLSHEAMRVTLGVGKNGRENFQEISYRPAYHSLTDNDYGLLTGAEINFLNSKWRHYDRSNKIVLQEFNILGIKSLSPINQMFAPTSFGINWDIWRVYNPQKQKEGYASRLSVEGGGTAEILPHFLGYLNAGTELAYGGFLEHNQYGALYLGGGAFLHFEKFKLLAEARRMLASTWQGNKTIYKAEVNVPLSTNWSVAAEYRNEHYEKGYTEEEFLTSIRHYF
ncbi:MAG: DUF4105 domain-containing protein [Alphaproteobacteria bacterium]|nr:DUF4105 domain-containing protein [Alphaproteobacteria bacterium]